MINLILNFLLFTGTFYCTTLYARKAQEVDARGWKKHQLLLGSYSEAAATLWWKNSAYRRLDPIEGAAHLEQLLLLPQL